MGSPRRRLLLAPTPGDAGRVSVHTEGFISVKDDNWVVSLTTHSDNADLENVFYNMNRKKTRVAITSGNYEFVPDSINNSEHSPFATVLIDILNNNNDVLPAGDLFSLVRTSLPKISKNFH